MKKILLTLACSFLLTACLAQPAEEKEGSKGDNTPSQNEPAEPGDNTLSEGENTPDGDQNSEDGGENEGGNTTPEQGGDDGEGEGDSNPSDGDEDEGDNPVVDPQAAQKTVTFTDGSFVGQLDQENKRTQFVTYFNGNDDLLSSVSLVGKSESKEFSNETLVNGEKVTEKHVYWWMGSASYTGKFTMNFNYDVVGIELMIQAYNKTYVDTWSADEPYVSYILDENAKLYIDTEDYVKDLSCSGNEKPDIVSFSKGYTTPTKQITIGNFEEGERVFIHSIKISYIA